MHIERQGSCRLGRDGHRNFLTPLKKMAGGDELDSSIEWWDEPSHLWIKTKPAVKMIRIHDIVHELKTCFMRAKEIGGFEN